MMNQLSNTKKLTLSAMFLAIGLILPFFTGQIQQIGNMLCPMHIPVLLCGFICGGSWGFIVGLIMPILRSAIFFMPRMFPNAVCMAVELAAYGLISGILYKRLAKKPGGVYISLLGAMVIGRLAWGAVMLLCMGLADGKFGLAAFWAGAVTNAVPGIIIQIIFIPMIVMAVGKLQKNSDFN